MNADQQGELESILACWIDETLTQEDRERLNDLLRDSSQARGFAIEYLELQSQLAQLALQPPADSFDWQGLFQTSDSSDASGGDGALRPSNTSLLSSIGLHKKCARREKLAWMLFAVTVAAALVLMFTPNFSVIDTATFVVDPTSLADDSSDETHEQAEEPIDRKVRIAAFASAELFNDRLPDVGQTLEYHRDYTLTNGMLKLVFPCGAEVTLQAPSIVELNGPMRMMVKTGHCSVLAPESAHGFRLDTPNRTIIDMGTKFSVRVDEINSTDVQVDEGVAIVAPASLDESVDTVDAAINTPANRVLRRRQAASWDGDLETSVAYDERLYLDELPDRVIDYGVENLADQSTRLTWIEVQRNRRVERYQPAELIGVTPFYFRAYDDDRHLIGTIDSIPENPTGGLQDDLLTTGFANVPGRRSPPQAAPRLTENSKGSIGLAVRFDRPVLNGPGPDIVFIEINNPIDTPGGDHFHVSPLPWREPTREHTGSRALTVTRYDIPTTSPKAKTLAGIQLLDRDTTSRTLDSLRVHPPTIRQPSPRFHIIATSIDLQKLGVRQGETVEALFIQDAVENGRRRVDPVFIGGLPNLESE